MYSQPVEIRNFGKEDCHMLESIDWSGIPTDSDKYPEFWGYLVNMIYFNRQFPTNSNLTDNI